MISISSKTRRDEFRGPLFFFMILSAYPAPVMTCLTSTTLPCPPFPSCLSNMKSSRLILSLGEESRHVGNEGGDEGVCNVVLQARTIDRSCLLLSADDVRALGETSG